MTDDRELHDSAAIRKLGEAREKIMQQLSAGHRRSGRR